MTDINREIAKRVMGWDLSTEVDDGKDDIYICPGLLGRDCEGPHIKFSPSTDPVAAMEVEAEMFRRGFYLEVRRLIDGFEDRFDAFFVNADLSETHPKKEGFTLPEAICRAALAATEE